MRTLQNHRHVGTGIIHHAKGGGVPVPAPVKNVNDRWPKAHIYGIRWKGMQFDSIPRGFRETDGVLVANLGAGQCSVYEPQSGWMDMSVEEFEAGFTNPPPPVYCRAIGWVIMPALTPVDGMIWKHHFNANALRKAMRLFEQRSQDIAEAQ